MYEWLVKRKMVATNICTYRHCDRMEIHTIIHYLVTYKPAHNFWQSFAAWWNAMNFSKIHTLVEEKIILGVIIHL